MTNILLAVFTCPENKKYFDVFVDSLKVAGDHLSTNIPDINLRVRVTDFSLYNTGMPLNFNSAVKDTKFPYDCKYFVYCNDDIALHPEFLTNAINYLEQNKDVGFVGGHSQMGGWNTSLDNIRIPEPIDKVTELKNMARLNWEFSACVFPVKVLDEVGELDELFSPSIGLCSDNDYLIRIKKAGYKVVRNYNTTFFHAKGLSQSRLRDPIKIIKGTDPHTLRARQVAFLKWGMNIPEDIEPSFDIPYNGKKIEIINIDTIKLDGEIIKLIEV